MVVFHGLQILIKLSPARLASDKFVAGKFSLSVKTSPDSGSINFLKSMEPPSTPHDRFTTVTRHRETGYSIFEHGNSLRKGSRQKVPRLEPPNKHWQCCAMRSYLYFLPILKVD